MHQPKQQIDYEQQLQIHDLAKDIEMIKDNHLAHLADDIHELKSEVKQNKDYFTKKFDKLDNRIWWIMGLTVTTLLAIVLEKMI